MGAIGRQISGAEPAVRAAKDPAVGQAAGAAQAPSNGSPARVQSRGLRPAPDTVPHSVQVEAAGREVAVAQAPGQGNEAKEGGSRLALVLNPLAPAETAQRVATRVAVARGQIAPAVPIAVPVVAEGAGAVEAVAGAGAAEAAANGDKANLLIGDSLLQGV